MTPPASWRPYPSRTVFIVGPAPCQGCGAMVWFGRAHTRVQGEVVMGEVKTWREWGRYAAHRCESSSARATSRRSRIKAPNRYPQLTNARAEWDNRQAGTSSKSDRLPTDPAALLVPGAAGSSVGQRRVLDA